MIRQGKYLPNARPNQRALAIPLRTGFKRTRPSSSDEADRRNKPAARTKRAAVAAAKSRRRERGLRVGIGCAHSFNLIRRIPAFHTPLLLQQCVLHLDRSVRIHWRSDIGEGLRQQLKIAWLVKELSGT